MTLGVQTFKDYVDSEALHARDIMFCNWKEKEQRVQQMIAHYWRRQRRDPARIIKAIDCRGFTKAKYLHMNHSGLHPDKIRELMEHDDFAAWWKKVYTYIPASFEILEKDLAAGQYDPLRRPTVDLLLVAFCEKGEDRSPALSRLLRHCISGMHSDHFQITSRNILTAEHLCRAGWKPRQIRCDQNRCEECFGSISETFGKEMVRATTAAFLSSR